mmetsp:Transcript_84987/g.275228  ORF Transcript_84987/g.275228 Transcript_84987/m.275228 type:complete len:176 (+) Transcript_84987:3-530(+)
MPEAATEAPLAGVAFDSVGLVRATGVPKVAKAPKKNKVVLMVLEIIPPCGQLGIDRFYLGSTRTAIAKLVISICTCLVGGFIWGFIDAITVIANCIRRQDSLDSLGMAATFNKNEVETARTLAIIGVVIQFVTCCGTPRAVSCIHRWLCPEQRRGAMSAVRSSESSQIAIASADT